MLDINAVLATLAAERPVFHSEADFQHALAWKIREVCGECQVQLEYPVPTETDGPIHLDIWVFGATDRLAIELKYKKKRLVAAALGESRALKDQGAQDEARYRFWRDIARLEAVVAAESDIVGYGIMLTNDQNYWNDPTKPDTADAAFRLHEGQEIVGPVSLGWGPGAHADWPAININGSYTYHWEVYSTADSFSAVSNGSPLFKYLLLEV